MLSPRVLRWLHRIGYLTTIVVALEACAIGYFAHKNWQLRQNAIESTRTHTGPMTAASAGYVAKDVDRLLITLPPLQRLPDGSLRLAVMPSFGREWFAIALAPRSIGTVATLIVAHRNTATPSGIDGWGTPQHFTVPRDVYSRMISDIDQLVERWPGEANLWTDGTPLAFERKKQGRVFSGFGNSPSHYGKVAALIRNRLAPYSPALAVLDEDWVAETNRN
ncbi:hypothetical protein EWE75_23825 [Sphingomonas populi]|uniref:Uncharacterized protein n=1 Tax=Sphingomonas populi TaxID=2484750 RepID=A0A4Q6XQW0_9SPHN|nr:hypothetical protein [Sphingomonas populi]RZF59059.1 hypothetical protein EWE75_23825 [Sphingomonas populi]